MNAITTYPSIPLTKVLAYRNLGVVRRYAKEYGASIPEAEEVFRETLKYLYLAYRSAVDGPEPTPCVVSTEIEKLDWMWHTFLLFTRDYAEFCERYFGFFLHHVPNEAEDGKPLDNDALRATVERQYALVYDLLGEDTLIRWYDQCRYAASAE